MASGPSKTLPTREISYNYCVAMFMAQQLEDGLRYILDSADYYGIIDEIELTKTEKKRYRDTAEWLDKATCGKLLVALKKRINLPEKHWTALTAAIEDRNFLAHRFLVQFDYDGINAEKEKKIVHVIYHHFLRLWNAVELVRSLRKSRDEKTDQIDAQNAELFKSIGVELKMPRKKTQR